MCLGNADMRWQFGGNFQPVRMICEEDWKECPFAVLNYFWSEVVTEVVDCLSNDILIWRIIAMMIAVIMLIHTVYYKLRWIDETSVNRDNLSRVGFKVQDLELKVNILTYKMQYGTWPLPHHMRKSDLGNELHNVRLTLSNSEGRNSWIKHLLLSPRKKEDPSLFNKNLADSVKSFTKLMNLETKYVSSKFQNDVSPIESGDKTVQSYSDNSTRKWKRCKKCFDITLSKQRQISKSENLGLRRRQSPKSIPFMKKENDSQLWNINIDSNETFIVEKNSHHTEEIDVVENQSQNLVQNQESFESYSESTNTYSDRNLNEENQLERSSSDLSAESDINHNTKMGAEGLLEKADDLEMERLARTENNLEIHVDDIKTTNESLPSAKSTNDTFYSWSDDDFAENTPKNETPDILPLNLNISFLTGNPLKPRSFEKQEESVFGGFSHQHSSTTTQETLHEVREKLKSLHNVILAHESLSDVQNESSSIFKNCISYRDAKLKESSKASFNMDIKKEIITEEELLSSSEYEQCESMAQSFPSSLLEQSHSNVSLMHEELIIRDSHYNQSNPNDSENEDRQMPLENSVNFSTKSFTKVQIDSRENLSESESGIALGSNQNDIKDQKIMENYVPMDTSEDQISQSSSEVESSNDETSDNQSTSALLQEALQFKDALMTQFKWKKELLIGQENIMKEEEHEDFINDSWPKVDNYFQTKVLDIITEEQSASSSTEKTSKTFVMLKMSEELDSPHHYCEEGNPKSILGSTSSEYFSVSNLSQCDKVRKEIEIESDTESYKSRTEINLPSKKRVLNSEISPIDLIKRSKYITHAEEKEKSNEKSGSERNSCMSIKQMKNFKDEGMNQDKNERNLKDHERNSEVQGAEEQNSNTLPPGMDSSSDESLTQFIREITNDEVKAAKIYREMKLNKKFAKSEENSFDVIQGQEQESTLPLQRRPGYFSLADNKSEENLSNLSESDLPSVFQATNLKVEETSKVFSLEVHADNQKRGEKKEYEFEEIERIIDKNMDKEGNDFENIDSKSNFDLDDSKTNPQSAKTKHIEPYSENFREDCVKEKNSEESIIEVPETKNDCMEFQESLKKNNDKFPPKGEISKNLDNQEKGDELQSNLTSDPSSSLYFTAEASNSDIKLNIRYPSGSTSVSKTNLEVQETIFEDANEFLTAGIKIYGSLNKEPGTKEEIMLIDLSDDDISVRKSEIEKPKTSREIQNEKKNHKSKDLNILDAVFGERIEEELCLIPKKIQPKNETQSTSKISETEPEVEIKGQDPLSERGISHSQKSTANPSNSKIKISEMNQFPHCSSAPSLQRGLYNSRKSSPVISSTSMKSKPKVETPIKSRTLVKSATPREKSMENTKENCKKNSKNSSAENSSIRREPRMKIMNLNLGNQSSGDQSERRSRSYVSPRLMQTSPRSSNNLSYEDGVKSARDYIRSPMETDQQVKFTSKTSLRSVESQKSTRSCIPILKTRLENIRKPEHRSRPRSPMRGPLTISPRPDVRDIKNKRDSNTKRGMNGGKTVCNEKSYGDNTDTVIHPLKEQCQTINDKTVICIEITTDQDQSKRKVIDPKKFLEFVKERQLEIHNVFKKEKNETDSEPKILTVVSSVLENDELPKKDSDKNSSFQVEQKEREVSVKPSVMDNSTSISDFPEICNVERQDKSQFKIFQVPEELTKDEYIDLLDSLNQDPNLVQLRTMHKLCSKLGVGFQE